MDIDKKTLSYCVGMNVANSLTEQFGRELIVEDFARAMEDVFNVKQTEYTTDQANKIITDYMTKLHENKFGNNIIEGKQFLEQNAKKNTITTTLSGLQYEILQEGNGTKPSISSQVTVHYHGTLVDGTVFDSSIQRGTPATFGVNQVIKGWTEALQLMNKGAKYRLYIPQELAYGANSPSAKIQPYSTLIFDVELIDFN